MNDHIMRMTQLRLEDAIPAEPEPPAMLTPDPLIVRLNKVFSWQQSASRWPYYLSRAEPGRAYTKAEIASEVFGDDAKLHETPAGKGWLTSVFGVVVDRAYAEVRIEGIGLFERSGDDPDCYSISADGLALAHAYSTDPASEEWKRVFVSILMRNDVRMRAILLYLARWGAYLIFSNAASASAFFNARSFATLRLVDGDNLPLFDYTRGGSPAYSFTPILQHDPYNAVGPFLREHIECAGVRVPERVELEGGRDTIKTNKEPSGNNLNLHMKQALSLFRDIGALVYVEHRQGWTLSAERCAELFEPALVADLFGAGVDERFLNALRAAYMKLCDQDGYVRVTDIRDYVADALDISPGERGAWFNAQVAHYLRPDVGKVRIGRTFHHQAAPSECLFGNLEMEYVEFTFTH